MKLFLQIGIAANHSVKGLILPDLARSAFPLVDFMGGERFNGVKKIGKRPKYWLALFVLLLDLRLKQHVNVIGHDARGIELVTALFVSVQNAFKHNVARLRRKLTMLSGRETGHVFRPWALEMRQAPLVINSARRSFCLGSATVPVALSRVSHGRV